MRIWVDTDIALGTPRGDVDDAFALAAVAASAVKGNVELLGVSAVSGNTDGRSAVGAAARLLDRFDGLAGTIPVVREEDAPAAMAALPEGAAILAIGPPTNLVRAAALDPSLPARVTVRAVGTVVDKLRNPILPFFCLNFRTDPRASRAFFSLPWRRTHIFPLDVVCRLRADGPNLRALGAGSHVGAYLEAGSLRWLRRAPLRYGARHFPVWDLVAALDAVGALPRAKFGDHAGRWCLLDFDPPAAWARFARLLEAA